MRLSFAKNNSWFLGILEKGRVRGGRPVSGPIQSTESDSLS